MAGESGALLDVDWRTYGAQSIPKVIDEVSYHLWAGNNLHGHSFQKTVFLTLDFLPTAEEQAIWESDIGSDSQDNDLDAELSYASDQHSISRVKSFAPSKLYYPFDGCLQLRDS